MGKLKRTCLWPQLVDKIPFYPQLEFALTVDACIIGAGITGLSAAIHLAQAGRSVCIVEAEQIAYGGSGRNVGLVNAGTWNKPDDIVKVLGETMGEQLNTLLGEAPSLVFSLIHQYNMAVQQTESGTLHMAHNAAGVADICERYRQLKKRGANVQLLGGKEAADYCGTTKIPAGLLDHRAGTINPYAYVISLAKTAVDLGVHIYEKSAVIRVEQEESHSWRVLTGKGVVTAEQVIIATNAYTEGDWTDLTTAIYTGYYYQIASIPLEGTAAESILPYQQGAWDTRMVLSSIRRDHEGRLLLGSMGNTANKPDYLIKKWADRIQHYYYPQLGKNIEWEYSWSGRIGFTDNHIPKLFELAKGLIAAIGYNGRGITTGTLMGKLFAEYLINDDPAKLSFPFYSLVNESKCNFRRVKSYLLECGFSIYHLGQCLNLIR